MTGAGRTTRWAALVAVLSAACWFGWLGWDSTYQVDPATGTASGPYEAWQVIGCAVCLAAVVVLGTTATRPMVVVASTAVAFTVAWSVTAASGDESGLWAVGAVLVLIGVTLGASVVAAVTAAARRRGRPPTVP